MNWSDKLNNWYQGKDLPRSNSDITFLYESTISTKTISMADGIN